jgi:DNA uptake protein ComE-like DNA-binding protein
MTNTNKRYEVLVAYISYNGVLMKSGVYEAHELDLAEARCKSIILEVDSSSSPAEVTVEKQKSGITNEKVRPVETVSKIKDPSEEELASTAESYGKNPYQGDTSLAPLFLDGNPVTVTMSKFKINSATVADMLELKHVTKSIAAKVIKARKLEAFISYSDLDSKVPLKGKSWSDVAVMDFNSSVDYVDNQNTIKVKELY